MKNISAFIGGQFVAGPRTFVKRSPVDGNLVALVHEADASIVDLAVSAAQEAKCDWEKWDRNDRAELLERLADAIAGRADDLADAEVADIGRPREQLKPSAYMRPCCERQKMTLGMAGPYRRTFPAKMRHKHWPIPAVIPLVL